MTYLTTRTCTEAIQPNGDKSSMPIEDLRERWAYILLGDPGSGKTESFKAEAKACDGFYISARDFLALSLPENAHGKTIFIDGLDESRAGEGDERTPLDRIRSKLDELGRPSFRLSCREADWLGASDRNALEALAPVGGLAVVHLDQLTRDQVQDILENHTAVSDPTIFLKNAGDRGLDALLLNPQTLNLLIEAVKENEWPSTRQETFRLACEKLATESNLEHKVVNRIHGGDTAFILHAAGGLCAIQLLADISGFTAFDGTRNDVVALRDISLLNELPISQALKTRLFSGIGEEQFAPVHRSVAEYLAACFIVRTIAEGRNLSINRVLALMTATDGGIVAGLRGLNAWLAVLHHESRRRLIQIDPLGVVLYGDVKLFSVNDKLTILKELHSLAQQYSGFRWQDWSAKPFGALATSEMADHFKSIFTSSARDEGSQALLDCLIDAVRYGEPLPQLKNELKDTVLDATRWPGIRKGALRAYIHLSGSQQNDLLGIAEDFRDGKIEDPDDEMLGVLLNELFPNVIPANEVFSYLHKPKKDHMIGRYHMFWTHTISEVARGSDIPILMDLLAAKKPPLLDDDHNDYRVKKMVGRFLCRATKDHGEGITDKRLYEWLGTALDQYDCSRIDREENTCIKEWLEAHPERYKGLLLVGIAKFTTTEKYHLCIYKAYSRFCGARPPHDLGRWWLDRADAEQDQEKAECFFSEAIGYFYSGQGATGLSVEHFEQWVAERPRFAPVYRRKTCVDIPDWRRENAEQNWKYKEKKRKSKEERILYFKSQLPLILGGDAQPVDLYDLACAYSGMLVDIHGETGLERLQGFLDGDNDLISAALKGLSRSIERPDLPTVDEILELDVKGRMHYIRQACLAGMEERYKSDPSQVLDLGDEVLETMIAFQYTYSFNEQAWFEVCVRNRSGIVAKVLIKHVLMHIKARKEHINGLYPLAHNEDYNGVSLLAVPPLLHFFPSHANKKLTSDVLEYLLKAALRYMEDEVLKNIIDKKLTTLRMNVKQRIYWLAAGIVVDFFQYESALTMLIGKSQKRRQILASFFNGGSEGWIIRDKMHERCLSYLVRMLAPICSPKWPEEGGRATQNMQTTDFVRSLLNRLGGIPTSVATEEIQRLLEDSDLSPWHKSIRHVMHAQYISCRETTFCHPTVSEVCGTFGNRSPANAADLAALTTEHLRELAIEIRHGNTDEYKQFWNLDQHARPTDPRHEEACRDLILTRLKDRLQRLGIEANPEGHYADDKRADIRVSYAATNISMAIPIEIKRDAHRDIWSAISGQLISRYTRDPESRGWGIFLAFWFGGKSMPAHPDGDKPTTAVELEELLVALVPENKKELISVCVIDCSLPEDKYGGLPQ